MSEVSGRLRILGRDALALWRTPLGKILCVALLLRLSGLAWGLPAADGWDDDGVAPRDFLVGVLETFWWGHHYTYPPLHLLVLAIVSAPIWLVTLLRAPSLDPQVIIHTFVHVPTMTALAVVARATTMAMSLGLLWNLAKIGEELRGSTRAGAWVAAACGLNVAFTYYSQTTNLDVPYLFWSVLALRWLVRAITRRDPSALRRVAILAAFAVATKDQAYALFLLGVPLTLVSWFAIDRAARPQIAATLKHLAVGVAMGLGVLLLVDGAVINPTGFAERVRFLLGAASQDHAYYAATWTGRWHVVRDGLLEYDQFYPWFSAPLVALGVAVAWRAPDRAKRAAGLVPLFAAVSFIAAFDMTARRSEQRFLLPQMLMFGIYAGLALDAIHGWLSKTWARGRTPVVAALVAVPCFGFAFFQCAAVDAAMICDPRYDAEQWLHGHVNPGDIIEVYDNNVHLPRLPRSAVVERVDVTPTTSRNPMPGIVEVRDRFSDVDARHPRFIVVSEFWIFKYLLDPAWFKGSGRVLTPEQARLQGEVDSRAYFHALSAGRLRYRLAHRSTWTSHVWPREDIHASLARDVLIYERVP